MEERRKSLKIEQKTLKFISFSFRSCNLTFRFRLHFFKKNVLTVVCCCCCSFALVIIFSRITVYGNMSYELKCTEEQRGSDRFLKINRWGVYLPLMSRWVKLMCMFKTYCFWSGILEWKLNKVWLVVITKSSSSQSVCVIYCILLVAYYYA